MKNFSFGFKLSIGLILLGLLAFKLLGLIDCVFLIIFLIVSSVLKSICSVIFCKKYTSLVLITNLISSSLVFGSFLYFTNNYISIPIIMLLIICAVLTALSEWGIFSFLIKEKYLKFFLFSLLSNMLLYGLVFFTILLGVMAGGH